MPQAPKDSGHKKRSDGDGSVYQRHSPDCPRPDKGCKCKWVGALVIGYRDKKPVRRRISANTKSGATTKLRELRDKHKAETLPASGKPVTVEQWMNHWLNNIAPRKVSPLTIQNTYRQKVADYIIPLLGHHRLDKLTADHIEEAWDHLAEVGNPKLDDDRRRPLAPNTVLQTHRILSRALKVAVQRHRLTHNPAATEAMDAPSGSKVEMTPPTLEETKRILAAGEGQRNAARWSVALALGLRQGEALGLAWEHVDLRLGVIHIRQALHRRKGQGLQIGGLKSDAGRRDLPIPPEMLPALRAHKKAQSAERLEAGTAWHDHGLVFTQANGKPLDPSRDWKAWRDLLRTAKVPHRRLHDARHAAATLMLIQGVPTRTVMELLGHSQISVTMRYQHVLDDLKTQAGAKVGAAIWG